MEESLKENSEFESMDEKLEMSSEEKSQIYTHQFDFKKSFKDYIFEFTLPFLAVMAAFLLNNVKEDYAENQLEKQYIISIISDLNDDIKLVDEQVKYHQLRIAQMDTLLDFFEKPNAISNNEKVNFLGKMASRGIQFDYNDRTIEQMKNSATFRLIKNQIATNLIIKYYQKVKVIKLMEDREKEEQEDYKRVAVKIFDPFSDRIIFKDGKETHFLTNKAPIVNNPELLREAAGYIRYLNSSRGRLISLKQDLKTTALQLIDALTKEYKLSATL
jgi:mannose/fructose/N-acetylgalactosamine-specific phosphotransferase system component IIB